MEKFASPAIQSGKANRNIKAKIRARDNTTRVQKFNPTISTLRNRSNFNTLIYEKKFTSLYAHPT